MGYRDISAVGKFVVMLSVLVGGGPVAAGNETFPGAAAAGQAIEAMIKSPEFKNGLAPDYLQRIKQACKDAAKPPREEELEVQEGILGCWENYTNCMCQQMVDKVMVCAWPEAMCYKMYEADTQLCSSNAAAAACGACPTGPGYNKELKAECDNKVNACRNKNIEECQERRNKERKACMDGQKTICDARSASLAASVLACSNSYWGSCAKGMVEPVTKGVKAVSPTGTKDLMGPGAAGSPASTMKVPNGMPLPQPPAYQPYQPPKTQMSP
jgi:hypothetical protein